MLREVYSAKDFQFAVVYLPGVELFYIIPVNVFISFGSEIHFVETVKRQRKPRSFVYREAWDLILQWATYGETHMG